MRRIIIITGNKYPDGDAGAIRQHMMAKILRAAGYEVFIYCMGNSTNGLVREHDGIEYLSMRTNRADIPSRAFRRATWGRYVVNDLQKRFDYIDAILLIDNNPMLFRMVENVGKRYGSQLIHDCVEWYSPEEFKLGKFDYRYIMKNYINTHIVDSKWRVISISQYLQSWFKDRCYRSVRIPVIMDMLDIDESELLTPRFKNKTIFTYAGAPGRKDYLDIILKGFSLLEREALDKVEIHIIGVTKEQLITYCGVDPNDIDMLGSTLVAHGRVSHEDAISWVRRADYTLLLRDETLRYAMAGFPTKIVESLKYGTPPVCNISSDLEQYLEDGKNAVLIDGCKPESVMIAVRNALQCNEASRETMRIASRETAIENFDYRLYSSTLLKLLTD